MINSDVSKFVLSLEGYPAILLLKGSIIVDSLYGIADNDDVILNILSSYELSDQ